MGSRAFGRVASSHVSFLTKESTSDSQALYQSSLSSPARASFSFCGSSRLVLRAHATWEQVCCEEFLCRSEPLGPDAVTICPLVWSAEFGGLTIMVSLPNPSRSGSSLISADVSRLTRISESLWSAPFSLISGNSI